MTDCKPKPTPCEIDANKIRYMYADSTYQLSDSSRRLYREIVGSLIYVMTCTIPDLCYIVSMLSQHMAKRTLAHLGMAKHVLHYGLKFQKSDVLEVNGFCDSDWGTSLSTREAEYMALAAATQEATCIRQLFADMKGCSVECVCLHVDNQGDIALARTPVQHQRSKHIDIKI